MLYEVITGGTIYLVDEFDDIIVAKAYAGAFPPPFPLPESLRNNFV